MARSYLGVVTRRGLERLVEETEHAARFLQRRAGDPRSPAAALLWAAIEPQDAEAIAVLAKVGLFRDALWRLSRDALHGGAFAPGGDPIPVWRPPS